MESMQRSGGLSINQLRTFQLVMQHGGYAAAAKICHLSVPSVWQHIQALEKAYGVRLFQKTGRRVEPTDAAARLFEQVDSILVQLESTFQTIDEVETNQPIRLVTGVRMMLEDLCDPLASFRREHPNRLVIRHAHDRRAEDLLLSDEADIAMALEPSVTQLSKQIHYEPAYSVEFLSVAKKTHPYAQNKTNTLRELAKHELIVTAVGTHGRDVLDEAFHQAGLKANIAIETDNSAFTIACVSEGMGVGILAGRTNGQLCKKLVTRSLQRPLGRRRIMMMWRKGRLLTIPMIDLIDHIMQID